MRVDRIAGFLRDAGCTVTVMGFSDLDLRSADVEGVWTVYASQEDDTLLYKSYIEDVVLALERKGARLVPRFDLFRAHHNKVYMEMLRDVALPEEYQTIATRTFGTLEEAERASGSLRYPVVVKPAEGAMSTGVALVENAQDFLAHAARISRSGGWIDMIKQRVKHIVRDPESITSIHRRKFIAQSFVSGLRGDHKVLVYGDRLYPFRRENRDGDFRASGSGRFHFDEPASPDLLDYCERLYRLLDCPYVSLDVGFDGGRYHLLEMQFMMFGNIGLERSVRYYRRKGRAWEEVRGSSDLEQVVASSLLQYFRRSRRGGKA
jgi:glutathione synthase/RimK-type ligase-like ATP-grasp enzyme